MGTNLSHLGKAGKSSTQKCLFGGDMLVSRRAILNNHVSKILVRSRDLFSKHCVDSQLFRYNSCYKQTLTWSEKRNCKQSTSKNITKTQVDGWMNSLFWKPLFIRCCGSTRPKKRTKPEKWRESKILTSWSWKKKGEWCIIGYWKPAYAYCWGVLQVYWKDMKINILPIRRAGYQQPFEATIQLGKCDLMLQISSKLAAQWLHSLTLT